MLDFLSLVQKNKQIIIENKKWIDLSAKLSSFETFQIVAVQGLGRLSIYLDEIDAEILQEIRDGKNETIEYSIKLSDAFTLSYLWVLGAYEAIRTTWELAKIKYEEGALAEKTFEKITETKKYFAKIRIPLAKMKAWKKDYSPIAYPILDTKRGIAWHIAQNEFISRKELSEAFLELLNQDYEPKK